MGEVEDLGSHQERFPLIAKDCFTLTCYEGSIGLDIGSMVIRPILQMGKK